MPKTNTSSSAPKHSTGAAQTTDKRITSWKALKAGFSETPAIFTVIISGKDCNGKEYHPLMAIGRAVVEFRKAIIVGSIEHILVSERVISAK